eukprot:7310056-Prymnesium_polylepis.2
MAEKTVGDMTPHTYSHKPRPREISRPPKPVNFLLGCEYVTGNGRSTRDNAQRPRKHACTHAVRALQGAPHSATAHPPASAVSRRGAPSRS